MNKKLFLGVIPVILLLTMSLVLAANNILLEHVETENIVPTTENGWGKKISEHPGNYGGIKSYGDGRLVTDVGADNPAYYTFTWEKAAAQTIKIRHLDGFADDSFTLEAQHCDGSWVLIGTYQDQYSTENWVTTEFSLSDECGNSLVCKGRGTLTIRITLIDSDHSTWPAWTTYGQLAIDWMELYGNGKPR